jgi:DNA invertase Pin-like site-specific DNA recombinase
MVTGLKERKGENVIRVYLRCSTDEQTTESQRSAIERWLATQPKEEEVKWYEEKVSGDAKVRPIFDHLVKEARSGVDTVVCWALDRLSRAGIVATLQILQNFSARGIRVVSVTEPWADTSNPVSEVVIAVMAWASQMEKQRIKARQKAGIEAVRKRNNGKCPWGGRPRGSFSKRSPEIDALVKELRSNNKTIKSIKNLTKLGRSTIYEILKS